MKNIFYLIFLLIGLNNLIYSMHIENTKIDKEIKIQPLFILTAIVLAKQILVEFDSKSFDEGIEDYIKKSISSRWNLCNLHNKMIKLREFKRKLKECLTEDAYVVGLIDKYLKQTYSISFREIDTTAPYLFEVKSLIGETTPLLIAKTENPRAAKIILEIINTEIIQKKETKNETNKTWLRRIYEILFLFYSGLNHCIK